MPLANEVPGAGGAGGPPRLIGPPRAIGAPVWIARIRGIKVGKCPMEIKLFLMGGSQRHSSLFSMSVHIIWSVQRFVCKIIVLRCALQNASFSGRSIPGAGGPPRLIGPPRVIGAPVWVARIGLLGAADFQIPCIRHSITALMMWAGHSVY